MQFTNFSMNWKLALFIGVAACPISARAAGLASEEDIADRRTRRMIELAAESKLHFPGLLLSDHDLFLLVTAAGASIDVRALGRQSQDPEIIAAALETALPGTCLAGRQVEWSKDNG